MRLVVLLSFIVGLGGYFYFTRMGKSEPATDLQQNVAFVTPELSASAQMGERFFVAKCAQCHGENALGSENGPPLIHRIYEPSHHGDEAFQRAAALGTRSHHWRFGDMPPVDGITRAEVAQIVDYIRETQRANGIN